MIRAGGSIDSSVTRDTSIIVVGVQDAAKVDASGKSSKQLKAEKLILSGQDIDVITESSFYAAIATSREWYEQIDNGDRLVPMRYMVCILSRHDK